LTKNSVAFNLYKNIVSNNTNANAIIDALKNSFQEDPVQAIKWFEELTKEKKNSSSWFYIQHTLFELLPEITEKNKNSAIKIFTNLLYPQFEESQSIIPGILPYRYPKRDMYDLTSANQKIRDLFRLAPKEYLSTVLELVLLYHQIPIHKKSKTIIDVGSIIWYRDPRDYGEIALLKTIESESIHWATKSDPKLNEILPILEASPYSLSVRILVKILLGNIKKHYQNLLLQIPKIISTDDSIDMLPEVLTNIQRHLSKSQVEYLNDLLLNTKPPKWFRRDVGSYRKYLLTSIPEKLKTSNTRKWITTNKDLFEELHIRQPPRVFTTISDPESKRKFSDLTDDEQELEIKKLLDLFPTFTKKDKKLEFLRNVEVFLNKDKKKINKDLVLLSEPCILKLCHDSDPDGIDIPDDEIRSSLISYPTIRASAASCLMRITWHNPTKNKLELIKEMANDKHSFVREEVCRNLRYLSATDYPLSLKLVINFLTDNWRVRFFIPDFLNFNALKHTDDVCNISEKIIFTLGKNESPKSEALLEFTTSFIIQMSLLQNNEKFGVLLSKLVEDESYNYSVKHTIAFACKDNAILFNKKLRKNVLEVYHKLALHKSSHVRSDAEFFLLYSITRKNQSFLPEIKPLLGAFSKSHRDLKTDYYKMNIIEYLEKFWKEIPDDSAKYLYEVYSNNEKLFFSFHRGRDVIKLIETMYKSTILSTNSKQKILNILLEFIKAGWSEANVALKHIEGRI